MRTVGILTNGGDTCSLNAVIATIRDNALAAGYPRILGFEGGFRGIMKRSVKLLTWQPIDKKQGGTILQSRRDSPRSDEEKKTVYETLKDLEVNVLVVIGGDGSLSACRDLFEWPGAREYKIRILGFPRTIDNDIRTNTFDGSIKVALCPGYPSAALKIARLTKDLRTTAMSTGRVFTIETMGRGAGWLAAAGSLAGAEVVLIPEVELKEEDWTRLYERVKKLYDTHGHVIICVSEGFKIEGKQVLDGALGEKKLGGAGVEVAKRVERALDARGRKVEVRCQHADYIPRMGSPSDYDLEFASVLGEVFLTMLEDGRSGELPVAVRVPKLKDLHRTYMSCLPLSRVEPFFFPVEDFYDAAIFDVTDSFINFIMKFVDPGQL